MVVVGSGTLVPDPERGPCALLVEAAGRRVLVDGGSGTLRSLARLGVRPETLDAGVYSHRHLDHIGELPTLLFHFDCFGRDRAYPLYGGGGLAAFVERLDALHGDLHERYALPVVELSLREADAVELAPGFLLRTAPAAHKHGALHLSFEADGVRVVFSGDTGPSPALVALATDADLLVTECAFAAPGVGHLCPADVADLVAEARPRRVVLTHLYPEVDGEVALATVRAAGAPVERAFDGWSHSSASRLSR